MDCFSSIMSLGLRSRDGRLVLKEADNLKARQRRKRNGSYIVEKIKSMENIPLL